MNIGIFTDTYTPHINGVVRSIETLRNNLEKNGHAVHIITLNFTQEGFAPDPSIIRLPGVPFLPEPIFKIGIPYSFKAMNVIKNPA